MTISGNVSIPGVSGQVQISVTGTSTLSNALLFAGVLNDAKNAGTLQISDLDIPPVPPPATKSTTEYLITGAGLSTTIPGSGAYLFDTAAGNTTVNGSGNGDNVLAAQGGAGSGGLTYIDKGGNNAVVFVNGNNLYEGSANTANNATDTVTAGQGHDTINTGANPTIVFSGTGDARITLADTTTGTLNDTVVLSDGLASILAFGADDLIFITGRNQTIDAGNNSSSKGTVVIQPSLPGANGSEMINAGAASLIVSDGGGSNLVNANTSSLVYVDQAGSNVVNAQAASLVYFDQGRGGNAILGGTGSLIVVSAPSLAGGMADTIQGGTGLNAVFGSTGSNVDFTSPSQTTAVFVASVGSETVNATGGLSALVVFGSTNGSLVVQGGTASLTFIGQVSAGGAQSAAIAPGAGGVSIFGQDSNSVSLLGQSGTGDFVAGAGNETLDGSNYRGNVNVFAANLPDSAAGAAVNESLVGGSGTNFFLTGSGNETIVAGSGSNNIQLSKALDGLGAMITIFNYTSSSVITFNGFTQSQEAEAIRSASATNNGLVGTQITLSDNTTVLFVDTAVSQLNFIK